MPSNFNSLLADALRVRTLRLMRVDAAQRKEVIRRLQSLERNLIKEVAGVDFVTRADTQARQIAALLGIAQDLIRNTYRDIRNFTQEQLQELARLEASFAVNSVNKLAGAAIMKTIPTDDVLDALAVQIAIEGSPAAAWWSRQAGDFDKRFADLITQGVAAGAKIDDLVKGVRTIRKLEQHHAEALVRTSVQKIANESRIATYRENEDVIRGLAQISTLDSRTTVLCATYDNAAWDLDYQPLAPNKLPWNGGPPRHFNCRSTTIPLTRSFAEMGLGDLADDIDPGTRASMDGEVSDKVDFNQFMDSKGDAFMDKVLGKGRADLYRRNKLSLGDLLDQQGNELSLADLKRLYPDS